MMFGFFFYTNAEERLGIEVDVKTGAERKKEAGRLHWGKYFPLEPASIAAAYPNLAEFRELCRQTDPHGVFCNDFVQSWID